MKQENRKDEIIQTATKLFKKKGYSAVTMRDIAKSMGIKAASLYNHINSKQDILTNIIISLAEEFTNEMNLILNSKLNSIEKLNEVIALHVKITSNNTNGMASLNNDWMHLEEKLDYYLTLRLKYEDDFREIIKTGITNKEISNSNPEIMLFSMLSTLRSLYQWIPKEEEINPKQLALSLGNVLINGIKK